MHGVDWLILIFALANFLFPRFMINYFYSLFTDIGGVPGKYPWSWIKNTFKYRPLVTTENRLTILTLRIIALGFILILFIK
jgi:hypothetical protein